MKQNLRNEARDYFVNHNFGIETILKIFGKDVSRKTLYNWRKEDDWDGQRKAIASENEILSADLLDLTRTVVAEAKANPTSKHIAAVAKMVGVLRVLRQVNIDAPPPTAAEVGKPEEKKTLSLDVIRQVEQELFGL